MLNLPDWALEFMKSKNCPYCGDCMTNSSILHIGIRMFKEIKPSLYFESKCKGCSNVSNTTIFTEGSITPGQIASEIFHAIDDSAFSKSASEEKNKINKAFDKEVDMLKKFMQKNESHIEFLKFIGLTDEEIEKYTSGDFADGK